MDKKHKIKYTGKEERRVYLRGRTLTVHKGDSFEVSKKEADSFKDKEDFKEMK